MLYMYPNNARNFLGWLCLLPIVLSQRPRMFPVSHNGWNNFYPNWYNPWQMQTGFGTTFDMMNKFISPLTNWFHQQPNVFPQQPASWSNNMAIGDPFREVIPAQIPGNGRFPLTNTVEDRFVATAGINNQFPGTNVITNQFPQTSSITGQLPLANTIQGTSGLAIMGNNLRLNSGPGLPWSPQSGAGDFNSGVLLPHWVSSSGVGVLNSGAALPPWSTQSGAGNLNMGAALPPWTTQSGASNLNMGAALPPWTSGSGVVGGVNVGDVIPRPTQFGAGLNLPGVLQGSGPNGNFKR